MKRKLAAGAAMLVLASGLAQAQGIRKPPNPNIRMMNGPVCANGFAEHRVSGGPNGTHSFVCATAPIRCPAPLSTAAGPVKRLGPQAAQFTYACSWATAAQQEVPKAGICSFGFAARNFVSNGVTNTMTGMNSANGTTTKNSTTIFKGSYECTGAPVQCPAPGAGNVYLSMSPEAGTSPSHFAAFSYTCSYTQVN